MITGRPVESVDTSSSSNSPPALPVSLGSPSVGTMTAEDPPLETLTRDHRPDSLLRQASSNEADLLSSLLGSGAEGGAGPGQAETRSQLTDLVWVILAVVVRLVLDTEYSVVIGQNIFLPFALSLALMMSLGYINISLATSTGSTILSAALMLCGVKPRVVGMITKSLSFLQQLTRTLSVYLFTFIVSHVIVINVLGQIL